MGMKINTSVSGLNAQRQAAGASKALQTSINKTASGLRINRAADDAAGLQAAEAFQSKIRQYTQEVNSLQTGVNVVQTADSALSTQQDGINRIRELATQAANGTLTDDQRASLNEEAQQIVQQLDETAKNTEFNGQKLLNGSTNSIDLGTEGKDTVTLNKSTAQSLGVDTVDLSTAEGAAAALDQTDTATRQISQNRASLGAQSNRFESAIEDKQNGIINASDSESRIRDLDFARGTVEQTSKSMLLQQALAATTQSNLSAQSVGKLLGSF